MHFFLVVYFNDLILSYYFLVYLSTFFVYFYIFSLICFSIWVWLKYLPLDVKKKAHNQYSCIYNNVHFRGSMNTISIKLNMFHIRSLESRVYSILLKVKPSLICNQIFNPKWVKNREKIWFVYGNKSLQFKRNSFCCEKFMIQKRWVLDREYYSTMNQKTEKG